MKVFERLALFFYCESAILGLKGLSLISFGFIADLLGQ